MIDCVVSLFLLFGHTVYAHKILVYNAKFGHSHSTFVGSIADRLVEAGHEVTTLIPELNPRIPDGTSLSRIIRVEGDPSTAKLLSSCLSSKTGSHFDDDHEAIDWLTFKGKCFGKAARDQCRRTLDTHGLVEQLSNEHFDVFVTENVDFCGAGLSHLIGAKSLITVCSSSLWEHDAEALGIPLSLSYNPSFFTRQLDPSSMTSRAWNLYNSYKFSHTFGYSQQYCEELFKEKYGRGFPDLRDIIGNASFSFTNSDPFLDIARPVLHKVIGLGGLSVRQPKSLDREWNEILSRRNRSVLVSFGSISQSSKMRKELKESFLTVFSRFPDVTFIWKYETPEDDFGKDRVAQVENVILAKWTPQSDLLGDPRLIGFISHGGMGSCQEAAMRGVPGLYIPLFGDQPRNALVMESNGIGIVYDKYQLEDTEKLTEAVRKLLEDNSLLLSARAISSKLANRPFPPALLLTQYVEFAARFGSSPGLVPKGRNLSFLQYHNIDIFLTLMFLIVFTLSLISYFSCILFKRLSPGKTIKAD